MIFLMYPSRLPELLGVALRGRQARLELPDALLLALQLGLQGVHPGGPEVRRLPEQHLGWKVRSARDRTIRTFQIGVRSEFLESKENHEKHRREKNHILSKFRNFR